MLSRLLLVIDKHHQLLYRSFHQSTISNHKQQIERILVANRGEIACRVIETCLKKDIEPVALYTSYDSQAKHVGMVDHAVEVDNYLNIEQIVDICREYNVQGVHPGYGFLSENPALPQALERASSALVDNKKYISFIGPGVNAIESMGDKITSKRIAAEAGVNTIPGYDAILTDADEAVRVANEVLGYPVMLKATSGGGGKGMRICFSDEEVREGFVLSTAEAEQSFGDGRLIIEKFVVNPHHIELQIVAAKNPETGETEEVLVFPERECSIQRRNQKVLEESPSMLLNSATRKEMSRQAVLLAKAVDYSSAGTIEFLVEGGDSKVDDGVVQNFYFLEMNTRLQVEHPVTEMVTGVDLVELMVRVAESERPGFRLQNGSKTVLPRELLESMSNNPEGVVPYRGWALEARIYAEDPIRNFLPSIGPLLHYEEPSTKAVLEDLRREKYPISSDVIVRVDSGAQHGSNISMFYDPMIAKLVTYSGPFNGSSEKSSPRVREQTIRAMYHALQQYVIIGVEHNALFLTHLLGNENISASKAFSEGKTPTNFINTHYPQGFQACHPFSEESNASTKTAWKTELSRISCAVASLALSRRRILSQPPMCGSEQDLVVIFGGNFGKAYEVKSLSNNEGDNENSFVVMSLDADSLPILNEQNDNLPYTLTEMSGFENVSIPSVISFKVNDIPYTIQLQGESYDDTLRIQVGGFAFDVIVRSKQEYELSKHMKPPPTVDTSLVFQSPMPGKIVSYAVEVGDTVEIGQELCTVEAMKMQNILKSPKRGRVKKVSKSIGSAVKADEILLEFDK